ncbi:MULTISPECIES: hypothetical protein [unclassified Bradyrhizobium]|uniref:hypothetical protein n=1 Tax=unclassified Bradyrhizobium TaxID=2631580 RepID=UPI0028EC7302|nr:MULTISPECIES: hypothetical protein [unclassified Bradyrhizobium]
MEALQFLIRSFALLAGIRGHIPQSDGFESFRDESGPTGLLGNIAMFMTTMFCLAAAVAFAALLALRWLS